MGAKVKLVVDHEGALYGWRINCPGCGHAHVLDKRWTFNGDVEAPVFTPSLMVNGDWTEGSYGDRCHTFIGCNGAAPGQIIFLDDCTHALRGVHALPDAEPMFFAEHDKDE